MSLRSALFLCTVVPGPVFGRASEDGIKIRLQTRPLARGNPHQDAP